MSEEKNKLIEGLVIRSTGSWYTVESDDGIEIECRVKGKFRIEGIVSTNPVSVGDHVKVSVVEDGTGVIKEIEDRTNYIIRKSVNLSKKSHIIAANIDQAILIITIKEPETYAEFADRFLVSAESFRIPVIMVFNKIDIYGDDGLAVMNEWIDIYKKAGYKTLSISALAGDNVEQVKSVLRDKVTLVSGNSGVGKSTLINFIEPSLNLKTAEISDQNKTGKHTTTFAAMHKLSFGGYIVDTPGVRSFGIYDLKKEHLSHYFPEMRALLGECKFPNCLHISEPNCIVLEKVGSGEISESRHRSYLSMMAETEEQDYR